MPRQLWSSWGSQQFQAANVRPTRWWSLTRCFRWRPLLIGLRYLKTLYISRPRNHASLALTQAKKWLPRRKGQRHSSNFRLRIALLCTHQFVVPSQASRISESLPSPRNWFFRTLQGSYPSLQHRTFYRPTLCGNSAGCRDELTAPPF